MQLFIVSRLLQTIPLLIGASILVFVLIRLIPGDPADIFAGPDAPEEVADAVRERYGLDKPIPVQYGIWVSNLLEGDLGRSYLSRVPVTEILRQRVPATTELAVAAIVVTLLVGITAGVFAALGNGGKADWVITSLTGFLVAMPSFWIGILAIFLFAQVLGWLPSGGRVSLLSDPLEGSKHLIMPALILSMNSAAVLSRVVKSSMLEVLHEDYVRTAVSKGLNSRQVISRHVLRNAMVPVVTVSTLQFGNLLGGAVITEAVFAWPGIGRLMLTALSNRDYAIVQGVLLIMVFVFAMLNLIADLIYGFLDPRIRVNRAS